MSNWLLSTLGVEKPVIAMCHLAALPGDPHYDHDSGVEAVVERARREFLALQDGGVDAVMFSNEFSLPYLTDTEPITAITMARVIGELRSQISIPFGVNVLWDAIASIDLAVATGASFVREVFTGVYASDFGTWDTNVGETARHRQRVGGSGVRLLYNLVPEAAVYMSQRNIVDVTRSTVFNARPDGICVSGLTAGLATDLDQLKMVKEAADSTPVFVNTGVKTHNVADQLAVADGAVVGTCFKKDGAFNNQVDQSRVEEFMREVHHFRGE